MTQFIKNVSNRFAIAVTTKNGVVTLGKQGILPVIEINECEIARLLNDERKLVELVELGADAWGDAVEYHELEEVKESVGSGTVESIEGFGFSTTVPSTEQKLEEVEVKADEVQEYKLSKKQARRAKKK